MTSDWYDMDDEEDDGYYHLNFVKFYSCHLQQKKNLSLRLFSA